VQAVVPPTLHEAGAFPSPGSPFNGNWNNRVTKNTHGPHGLVIEWSGDYGEGRQGSRHRRGRAALSRAGQWTHMTCLLTFRQEFTLCLSRTSCSPAPPQPNPEARRGRLGCYPVGCIIRARPCSSL
jgi:hypothetical protein